MARWLVLPAPPRTTGLSAAEEKAMLALNPDHAAVAALRAQLAAQRPADDEDGDACPPVLPCNWDAARVFALLRTQWRTVGGQAGFVYLGLDLGAPLTEARLTLGLPPTPQLRERLEVMETEARTALNDHMLEQLG